MATAEIWKATRVLVDGTQDSFSPVIVCIPKNGLVRRERSKSNRSANCEQHRSREAFVPSYLSPCAFLRVDYFLSKRIATGPP